MATTEIIFDLKKILEQVLQELEAEERQKRMITSKEDDCTDINKNKEKLTMAQREHTFEK